MSATQRLTQHIALQGDNYLYKANIEAALNPPLAKHTKSVFVVGAVGPSSSGTALYDIGNGNPRLGPLDDNHSLDAILTIKRPRGEHQFLDSLWDAQIEKFDEFQNTMNSKHTPRTQKNHFMQFSFARTHNKDPVFDIRFPKTRPRQNDDGIVMWRDINKVALGAVYHPSLMDHGSHPFFGYNKSVLVQPEVRDTSGSLVPPWFLQSELRPESLVVAEVYLTAKDSAFMGSDGVSLRPCRIFRIWAKNIHILERGCIRIEQNPVPSMSHRIITYIPEEVKLRVRKQAERRGGGRSPKRAKKEMQGARGRTVMTRGTTAMMGKRSRHLVK